jgi:Uma2 family endonuclease
MLAKVSTARRLHHSYEDYLRALELSAVKLEYCDGEMYAMAGGTPAHADLAASMTRLLGNALLGRCRVSSSDLKVRIEATDLSTFPDVSVVCGAREVAAVDPNAVTNPTLLVEVTSHSTEDYDRGDKLGHYKQLPSLAAVLFVSHRRAQVTLVERGAMGWEEREHRAGETVTLANPNVSFAVDELYAGIELDTR